MCSHSLTLFDLAYACRIYGEYEIYGSSYERFKEKIGGPVDLRRSEHRRELVKLLNVWGCRQFAREYHELAAEQLDKWAKRWQGQLPSRRASLLKLRDKTPEVVAGAFDDLRGRTASKKVYVDGLRKVTFGPTGAAKILYFLRPNLSVPWDGPIRKELGYGESGEEYVRFLLHIREKAKEVIEDARRNGIAACMIPKEIGRHESNIPKLIDEYYWVTKTRGFKIPRRDEVRKWAVWVRDSG